MSELRGPRLLDGRATAERLRGQVAAGCARLLQERSVVPGLTVVLVGEDPASEIYVRNKKRAAEQVGMRSEVLRLAHSTDERTLLDTLRQLNDDPRVHGILVQLPLPDAVREDRVIETLDPRKDVDGFHPDNVGRLLIGLPGFLPCTPAGIIEMLRDHDVPLAGRHAVVIGRSNIVGKPMSVLLLRENCTVTICHSRTRDIESVAAMGDLLIAAVGRAGFVGAPFIKSGAAVVDVGVHRIEDRARCRELYGEDPARLAQIDKNGVTLVGDVHPLQARERAGWLSPVPGGVGPLTIAQLLRNTLEAAERQTAPSS